MKNGAAAIEEFALSIGLLVRRIRTNAPRELQEFSWTQKAVLTRLEKEGPATTADLARAESVTPQSMGIAVASLEEMGLLERKAHPTDGRQMLIGLSAKGAAMRKSIRDAKLLWLSQAIARLDKQEQATLFKTSQIIKRMAA
ncbi:MAG TPA: MarR family transcriptional regulator, partial [Myxococcales bacterium]|nr:MarR family transcriptional regulator [Myxococcales bacterium]